MRLRWLWVCGGVAVGVVWAMGGAVGEGGWKQKGGGSGAKNGWAGPLLSQGCPPPTPFACAALVPTNYPLLGSCHACCCLNCMPNCMIVVQAQLGCAPVQVGLIGPNRLPHPRCAYCIDCPKIRNFGVIEIHHASERRYPGSNTAFMIFFHFI